MEATTEFHHKVDRMNNFCNQRAPTVHVRFVSRFIVAVALIIFPTFAWTMTSLEVWPGARQHGDQQEDGHPSGFAQNRPGVPQTRDSALPRRWRQHIFVDFDHAAVHWKRVEEGRGLAESDYFSLSVAALQQRCFPALPLHWESTVCGGEGLVSILYANSDNCEWTKTWENWFKWSAAIQYLFCYWWSHRQNSRVYMKICWNYQQLSSCLLV